MKKLVFLLIGFFCLSTNIFAIYDPSSVPNNKFGIHIADSNDMVDVQPLVNSTGGDWGYVTLVIMETDRSIDKWQKIFNLMRRLHLTPIVRLATHPEGAVWAKPKEDSFDEWVDFLSKLNWPIENRYVILFNEPNHSNEMGGTLDPAGYAHLFVKLTNKFKEASSDFFIMPAGLDASAASDGYAMDEGQFLSQIVAAEPQFLKLINGWASHSYPNPGFSASPYRIGRGSLYSYRWELNLLYNLGLTKTLPVFITETGWIHSQGKIINRGFLSPDAVGENLKIAARTVWTDPTIAAVTPFIFNYQGDPFDHFSWKSFGGSGYYPQYSVYQSIAKTKGQPRQIQKFILDKPLFPDTLVASSSYTLKTKIANEGQGIVDSRDDYTLEARDGNFVFEGEPLPILEPGQTGEITLHVQTPLAKGIHTITTCLRHFGQCLEIETKKVQVVPASSVKISAQLAWRKESTAKGVSVLVYDREDKLIHKFINLNLDNGKILVKNLTNVVPNQTYRIVLLVPNFLPRQSIQILTATKTEVKIKRLLPLDFHSDGKFDLNDLLDLFRLAPRQVISLFLGP